MHTSETGITQEERAHVIHLLHESENEFLRLTSALSDAQWTGRAAPGGWTVAHIAEHLVLGERAMLAKIEEALAAPPDPEWERHVRKTVLIARGVPDNSRKATAPPALVPHRQWAREETIERYQAGRARTLRFAAETDQPLKHHLAEHPFPVFNMLNAYQWLLYIPLHNVRHNRQIAEALVLRETAP